MVVTVEPGCYFNPFLLQPAFEDSRQSPFLNNRRLEASLASGPYPYPALLLSLPLTPAPTHTHNPCCAKALCKLACAHYLRHDVYRLVILYPL